LRESVKYRVGVDIGGTFTDIVLLGTDGLIATKKVSSTPDDFGRGIVNGIKELIAEMNIQTDALEGLFHATTVATNSILEGKGALTALITTSGFRDVLELRRIRIPELYNLFYEKPKPLVPRRLRFEVDERIGSDGKIMKKLDMESLNQVIQRVKNAKIESVAICLLHSYANPENELTVTKMVREALPGTYVTCSNEILPEIREYERTSTTVINAYVGPIVHRYLSSLRRQLQEIEVNAPLQILQSGGGVMTADSAMEKPAHIIESGPAAGVIAAAWALERAGKRNAITLDMGGTTAKSSMIEDGQLTKTFEYEVGAGINISSKLVKGGGYALKLPFIDVSEIGAGGGSIVSIENGLLKVGPQSAGAVPGPVCYDLGGEEPTFTDAMITLGYISSERLVGGQLRLNAEKAKKVFQQKIAEPIGKSLLDASFGVYTLACSTMVRAVKAISTYRGRDPRDFVLFAFGGNGPIAASEIARVLQIKTVVVPPNPGVFSAFGLLFSNVEHEFVQTYLHRAETISPDDLNKLYRKLEEQAKFVLGKEGYQEGQIIIRRGADLRYFGQTYELTVGIPEGILGKSEILNIAEAFQEEHLRTYGHRAKDDPVDFVNLRVVAQGLNRCSEAFDSKKAVTAGDIHLSPGVGRRPAYFGSYGLIDAPVISRMNLDKGKSSGPLIIEEYDSTCIIPPGCHASLDEYGNIIMEVR